MEQQLPIQSEGPFVGMMANAQVEIPPGHFAFLQNVYVQDGNLLGRSGIQQVGVTLPDFVQGIYEWEMLSGESYTTVFANGDMYIYDWSTNSFAHIDLATEGVTLSTTNIVECCTSRGRLVFTDGVNQPVMATGPLATISFDTITLAPVARRCGVYYDKVFFWDIPGYENEFQWSDEGNPLTGYVSDDQAWEFAQTDAGRIVGMAPLNERNVILKRASATMLMGAVDEAFQTLAVREGLSETEGTVAGGSVIIYQGDVYCLSENGPRLVAGGQSYQSIHEAGDNDYLYDIWSRVNVPYLDRSLAWIDKRLGHIGWLVPMDNSTDLNTAIVFNAKHSNWTTFKFEGLNLTACGSVRDNNGRDWVFFGDENGNVYRYRSRVPVFADNGSAIEIIIRSRPVGGDHPSMQKRLLEVQYYFDMETDFVGVISPYIDGDVLAGRTFGIHDRRGKKRYRRGFNHIGYRLGWNLSGNALNQTIILKRFGLLASAVDMTDDWDA